MHPSGQNFGGAQPGIGGINANNAAELAKSHLKHKVMVIDDVDRQVWELVSNVPYVSKPVAGIQALLNLIFPGVGTWVAACAAQDNVSKT